MPHDVMTIIYMYLAVLVCGEIYIWPRIFYLRSVRRRRCPPLNPKRSIGLNSGPRFDFDFNDQFGPWPGSPLSSRIDFDHDDSIDCRPSPYGAGFFLDPVYQPQ